MNDTVHKDMPPAGGTANSKEKTLDSHFSFGGFINPFGLGERKNCLKWTMLKRKANK